MNSVALITCLVVSQLSIQQEAIPVIAQSIKPADTAYQLIDDLVLGLSEDQIAFLKESQEIAIEGLKSPLTLAMQRGETGLTADELQALDADYQAQSKEAEKILAMAVESTLDADQFAYVEQETLTRRVNSVGFAAVAFSRDLGPVKNLQLGKPERVQERLRQADKEFRKVRAELNKRLEQERRRILTDALTDVSGAEPSVVVELLDGLFRDDGKELTPSPSDGLTEQ